MIINLKLFDIDGCMHHKKIQYFVGNKIRPARRWLVDGNKDFLETLVAEACEKQYEKLIIACGSARQDKASDKENAIQNGNGSCILTFPLLQKYFSKKLEKNNVEVVFDPFLMADIYQLESEGVPVTGGESYKAILRSVCSTQATVAHAGAIFDETKILLIYAHAHRIASLHSNEDIIIDFYDDRSDILGMVATFFYDYPTLLPKNVTLRITHYADGKYDAAYKGERQLPWCDTRQLRGLPKSPVIKEVCGIGKIDEKYDVTVIYMCRLYAAFNEIIRLKPRSEYPCGSDLAAFLKALSSDASAEKQAAIVKCQESSCGGLPNTIETKGFSLFWQYAQQILSTQNKGSLCPKSGAYTTASQLIQDGLIPAIELMELEEEIAYLEAAEKEKRAQLEGEESKEAATALCLKELEHREIVQRDSSSILVTFRENFAAGKFFIENPPGSRSFWTPETRKDATVSALVSHAQGCNTKHGRFFKGCSGSDTRTALKKYGIDVANCPAALNESGVAEITQKIIAGPNSRQ